MTEEVQNEGVKAELATLEVGATSNAPTQEDPQVAADKIAVQASGKFHLDNLFRSEVAKTHGVIANTVAQIIYEAERPVNWTIDEVKAVWDRVAEEMKGS